MSGDVLFGWTTRTNIAMSQLEVIIVVLLLLMSIPDLCRRFGRQALTFLVYILFGVCGLPFLADGTRDVLSGVGHFGFILLLFVVGLEIKLPGLPVLCRRVASIWWPLFILYVGICLVVFAVGFSKEVALFSAAALAACSISMAFPALRQLTTLTDDSRVKLETTMVLLEVQAMIMLVAGEVFLHHGVGWRLPLHLLLVVGVIAALAFTADHVSRGFRAILDRTTHWKTHLLVLVILVICALGDRLGLPAPKTAFFLGLFMAQTTGHGLLLEEHLAPISHRFLIPVFFVALGAQVDLVGMSMWAIVSAVCAGVFILELKLWLFARAIPNGKSQTAATLILSPNLTIVAIAAETLYRYPPTASGAAWLVLCGLSITFLALIRLPPEPHIP